MSGPVSLREELVPAERCEVGVVVLIRDEGGSDNLVAPLREVEDYQSEMVRSYQSVRCAGLFPFLCFVWAEKRERTREVGRARSVLCCVGSEGGATRARMKSNPMRDALVSSDCTVSSSTLLLRWLS